MAEPPAESPSTKNNSVFSKFCDAQSANLPGRAGPLTNFLRTTFLAAFNSDSTGKRYVVLDKNGPVSWCMLNNQLYRYANYNTNYGAAKTIDWFISQATAGSSYSSLMAEHVSNTSLFKVTASTLLHNAALDFSLQLTTDSDGNKLILNRHMQVNYVP